MRVTIWQQFASNHSSSFTVVGEFKTDEEADAAYQTWYELITSVTKWWEQRDQSPYWNWEHGPSDPETDFSKKHDITWQENPIDWFGQPNELQKVLQKVRNRVLVNVEFETWQSPELAEKIMSSLGGKTIKQTSEDITLLVNFSCYGPDEKKAQEVYADWVSRIKVDERWGNDLLPPWETIFSLDITKTQIMGKALYFQVAFFHLRELAEMVNYFERLGFTNIEFAFEEQPISWRITCIAQNLDIAKEIYEMVQKNIEQKSVFPWLINQENLFRQKSKLVIWMDDSQLRLDGIAYSGSEIYAVKDFLSRFGCTGIKMDFHIPVDI